MHIEIFVTLYWYLMKILLFIYKYYNKLLTFIFNYYYTYYPKIIMNVILVKDSTIKYECNSTNLVNLKNMEYDYIIYKDISKETPIVHICSSIDEINTKTDQLCSFTFLSVLIKTENFTQDISSFLKDKEQYYVCDANLFNKHFMNWLSINYKWALEDYKILILDNNCNDLIVNKNQSLKLNYDNYEILSN